MPTKIDFLRELHAILREVNGPNVNHAKGKTAFHNGALPDFTSRVMVQVGRCLYGVSDRWPDGDFMATTYHDAAMRATGRQAPIAPGGYVQFPGLTLRAYFA